MRVGTTKGSKVKKAVKKTMASTVKHKHVGSPAFDVNDPVQRLMFTIGSGFFGEDKFYDSLQSKDWQGHHTSKARSTTRWRRRPMRGRVCCDIGFPDYALLSVPSKRSR